MRRIHGVEDILLGFEPKDAGSIPAGSVSGQIHQVPIFFKQFLAGIVDLINI